MPTKTISCPTVWEKDHGHLRHLLGIKVSIQGCFGHILRKYALNNLEKTGMLNTKPMDTSIDSSIKVVTNQGGLYWAWEIQMVTIS